MTDFNEDDTFYPAADTQPAQVQDETQGGPAVAAGAANEGNVDFAPGEIGWALVDVANDHLHDEETGNCNEVVGIELLRSDGRTYAVGVMNVNATATITPPEVIDALLAAANSLAILLDGKPVTTYLGTRPATATEQKVMEVLIAQREGNTAQANG